MLSFRTEPRNVHIFSTRVLVYVCITGTTVTGTYVHSTCTEVHIIVYCAEAARTSLCPLLSFSPFLFLLLPLLPLLLSLLTPLLLAGLQPGRHRGGRKVRGEPLGLGLLLLSWRAESVTGPAGADLDDPTGPPTQKK